MSKRETLITRAKTIAFYIEAGLVKKEHKDELLDGAARLLDGKGMSHHQQELWGFYCTTKQSKITTKPAKKRYSRKAGQKRGKLKSQIKRLNKVLSRCGDNKEHHKIVREAYDNAKENFKENKVGKMTAKQKEVIALYNKTAIRSITKRKTSRRPRQGDKYKKWLANYEKIYDQKENDNG